MGGQGDFVVTWEQYNTQEGGLAVDAERFLANGTPAGAAFQVSDSGSVNTSDDSDPDPAVAMDRAGDFTIVWTGDNASIPSEELVYSRSFDAAGTAYEAPEFVDSGLMSPSLELNPSVSLDAQGYATVVWMEVYPNTTDPSFIRAQRLDLDGGIVGLPFLVDSDTEQQSGENFVTPSTSTIPGGSFLVDWTAEDVYGNSLGVFGQAYAAAAAPAGPVVGGVYLSGDLQHPIDPRGQLIQPVPGLTVTFSEALAAGAADPSNWSLTQNGTDITSSLSIGFGYDPTSGKYEATLTPSSPLEMATTF